MDLILIRDNIVAITFFCCCQKYEVQFLELRL